ncbi:MAG: acyl-CoA dehydrogenase family protein [Eubacteriales bacterium]|nr:acyl-CoA dehydrogenase family protein [Eubacteriales bacterium]
MVNFSLTEEQKDMQKLFRDFAQNEIAPIAERMDEEEKMDMDLIHKMMELGFFGVPFSEEVGGTGMDYLTYVLEMEEISKVCGSCGVTISVHTSLCASIVEQYATPEQKEKWLRPLVDGSKIGCFGLTEPNAGSDVAGAKTTADKDGDYYVINGSKIFTTNSGFADTFLVFALTDKSLPAHKGMSAFLVSKETPGVEVQPDIKRMGIRAASNAEVYYNNVRVHKDDMLGKEGQGFKIAMQALDGGRIGIAAQSVGLAQGALDAAIKYCKERKQFGKPITAFQNTQFRMAEDQAMINAARLLTWQAAVAKDNHENYNFLAAQAKLVAATVANDVCRHAVQYMGGYGYCREYGVERLLRDVKITEIYEGTSEVQKMVMSGNMLR